MSEKKGLTVKMQYDFETASNLEVFLPTSKEWYRVTSRQFRSWTGKRRINEVDSHVQNSVKNFISLRVIDGAYSPRLGPSNAHASITETTHSKSGPSQYCSR